MRGKFVWLAEGKLNGRTVYARAGHPALSSDFPDQTFDPHLALKFPNRPACEAWVRKHPGRGWRPVEHGFG